MPTSPPTSPPIQHEPVGPIEPAPKSHILSQFNIQGVNAPIQREMQPHIYDTKVPKLVLPKKVPFRLTGPQPTNRPGELPLIINNGPQVVYGKYLNKPVSGPRMLGPVVRQKATIAPKTTTVAPKMPIMWNMQNNVIDDPKDTPSKMNIPFIPMMNVNKQKNTRPKVIASMPLPWQNNPFAIKRTTTMPWNMPMNKPIQNHGNKQENVLSQIPSFIDKAGNIKTIPRPQPVLTSFEMFNHPIDKRMFHQMMFTVKTPPVTKPVKIIATTTPKPTTPATTMPAGETENEYEGPPTPGPNTTSNVMPTTGAATFGLFPTGSPDFGKKVPYGGGFNKQSAVNTGHYNDPYLNDLYRKQQINSKRRYRLPNLTI